MKFWIRIVIAIAAIVVVGVGVWAFWFKETDEVQAYNRTAELLDFKESLAIKERLVNLRNTNYYGNDSANEFDDANEYVKKINNIRKLCLSDEVIVQYDSTGEVVESTFVSYFKTDDYVDEAIEHLLPFTKSDRVVSSSLKTLKKSISMYIESLEQLNLSINNVVNCQSQITGSDLDYKILSEQYTTFDYKYKNSLKLSSQVIIDLLNYINKSVYSSSFLMDTHSALYDSFARSLKASLTCDDLEEYLYAGDVYYIIDKIDKTNNSITIYNEVNTEYDFLNAYNYLFQNYQEVMGYVFNCVSVEKKQMAVNANLSKIVEKAKPSVVIMLKVLGF